MKNKLLMKALSLSVVCFLLFSATACGEKPSGNNNTGYIGVKALSVSKLGEGFREEHLPDTDKVKQYSGKIDVCLDFEGTQYGWQAVAAEYERLQGGSVKVNVNTNFSGSTYTSRINQELLNPDTDWDIVEGNLAYSKTEKTCIDMYSALAAPNPYCGKDVTWASVLDSAAYKTSDSDTTGKAFIMNSEVMQTCWFINNVAFEKAKKAGWSNASGKEGYPETWDDLISLCSYMETAGYSNPLGITLCSSSIESLQFTWLLRVYGDYYYRQFYKYIMNDDVWQNYSKKKADVESLEGYGVQYAKLLNILFDEDSTLDCGYVGFDSEVYLDFVKQLEKMKGHLMENVDTTEFSALRDLFYRQSRGDKSPQIMLDYQGFGIAYSEAESASFEVGYFDYPQMISGKYTEGDKMGKDIVDPDTLTRDIGGNGGFLSVVNHLGNSDQNELNKDFIKFFMSPYGQTIYYKGLAANNAVPKGVSSVKNDLVVVPEEWKSFFEESNKTITFSGNSDNCSFLSFGVRYTNGFTNGQKIIVESWRKLLMGQAQAGELYTVYTFVQDWGEAAFKDMLLMQAEYKWPSDTYLHPDKKL